MRFWVLDCSKIICVYRQFFSNSGPSHVRPRGSCWTPIPEGHWVHPTRPPRRNLTSWLSRNLSSRTWTPTRCSTSSWTPRTGGGGPDGLVAIAPGSPTITIPGGLCTSITSAIPTLDEGFYAKGISASRRIHKEVYIYSYLMFEAFICLRNKTLLLFSLASYDYFWPWLHICNLSISDRKITNGHIPYKYFR